MAYYCSSPSVTGNICISTRDSLPLVAAPQALMFVAFGEKSVTHSLIKPQHPLIPILRHYFLGLFECLEIWREIDGFAC